MGSGGIIWCDCDPRLVDWGASGYQSMMSHHSSHWMGGSGGVVPHHTPVIAICGSMARDGVIFTIHYILPVQCIGQCRYQGWMHSSVVV